MLAVHSALVPYEGALTVSSARPLRTFSVVAATFPPLRDRSQAMARRSSCGNMCAIWSICAGLTRGAARLAATGRATLLVGLLRYHRTANTVTTTKTSICGMLSVCSVMLRVAGSGGRMAALVGVWLWLSLVAS